MGVPPVVDPSGPAEIRPLSANEPLPKNSFLNSKRRSVMLYNRFSRSNYPEDIGWDIPSVYGEGRRERTDPPDQPTFQLQNINSRG